MDTTGIDGSKMSKVHIIFRVLDRRALLITVITFPNLNTFGDQNLNTNYIIKTIESKVLKHAIHLQNTQDDCIHGANHIPVE